MTIKELKKLLVTYDENLDVEVYVSKVADIQEIVAIDPDSYGVIYLMVNPKQ